jgi:hypothetical protein
MPVITRSQHHAHLFKETIENPCILKLIAQNLHRKDIVAMKQVSKDERFNDVLDQKLAKIVKHRQKVMKITKKVANYLLHVESLYHKSDKLPIVKKMYEFLCKHKWFVKEFPQFEKVVHDKLIELIHDVDFREQGLKYVARLFDLQPPKKYYNSQLGLAQYGMFDMHGKFVDLSNT